MLYYPPEWSPQKSIWLSFPHNENEWGKERLETMQDFYIQLSDLILNHQNLNLIFNDQDLLNKNQKKIDLLENKKFKLNTVIINHNDIWIRDYGPFFLKENKKTELLDFEFNAWGGKFPPWDLDNQVPKKISQLCNYPLHQKSMILEGGALEFNGDDLVMTTKQCLLNKNRNPDMSQKEIEDELKSSFNIQEIIWLERGIEGDHTDGHIDDFARFYAHNKIFLCQAEKTDANYQDLENSFALLNSWSSKAKSYQLEVTRLPMPEPKYLDGERLASSYANFIFLNGAVIVPNFNCAQDREALGIFKKELPNYKIESIDSSILIEEGGGLHCMSKQESL